MKIKYQQLISRILNENDEIEEESEFKSIILVPEENEAIKNKITGEIINGRVGIGSNDSIDNYEIISKETEE